MSEKTDPSDFLTIAGRWRQRAEQSGLNKLPTRDQALCVAMFYAGFSAALEANMEVADYEDYVAMRLFACMQDEVKVVESMLAAIVTSGMTRQ